MTARVEVDPALVSCSVRYALGRHSYLPGLVADEVRRTWPELGEQRTVIREDIARWLEQMGTSDYVMGAGWSTARPTWEQLLRWIDTRNASDVKDACPRCGSTKPSRRFSSDNGRTYCGHGWHDAPLDPEEAEMRADQIHDGPLDGTRLSAEGRPMAERVQMTRKRPWRADHPDAVIVARPTQWGNPYRIERHMFGGWTIRNTATDKVLLLGTNRRDALLGCVELYRQAIEDQREFVPRPSNIRYDLAGRDLACWCPLDQPCHADVLLELANAREDRGQSDG